ncbi:MAG: GNAT family N-acetyltransferase [Actinomycetota bacterium]
MDFAPFQADDADRFVAFLVGDEWPFHAPSRMTIHEARASAAELRPGEAFWIRDAGVDVGTIRLLDLDDIGEGAPMFDLRIAERHRGRGIGSSSTRWIARHVFDTYPDAHRIEATTRADNDAMRHALEAAGFEFEGTLRSSWRRDDGSWADTAIFGLLRHDGPTPAWPATGSTDDTSLDVRLLHPDPGQSAHLDPVCVSCTAPGDDPITFAVTERWKVVLHPDQTTPGSLLIVSLRHVAKVGDLTTDETEEFFALFRRAEAALEHELGAAHVTLSCLRNWAFRSDDPDPPWLDGRPNPHVHWHLVPRYAEPVTIDDDTFVDDDFGHELVWRGRRISTHLADVLIDRIGRAMAAPSTTR